MAVLATDRCTQEIGSIMSPSCEIGVANRGPTRLPPDEKGADESLPAGVESGICDSVREPCYPFAQSPLMRGRDLSPNLGVKAINPGSAGF
jgi:hypothetical protein